MTGEAYEVELDGDTTSGVCPCCGNVSRQLTGFIHRTGGATVAGYSVHWTEGHYPERPANLDLLIGRWGEDAGPEERVLVSLLLYHRDGVREVYVIDAADRPMAKKTDLVRTVLARSDVIGTPLANEVFGLTDAISLEDQRLPVPAE